MENMLFAHKPNLCSVHPQEPQVLSVRDQVAASVTAALVPAHQFLARLQPYNAWLQLDVPAYIASLEVSRALLLFLMHRAGCCPQGSGCRRAEMKTTIWHPCDHNFGIPNRKASSPCRQKVRSSLYRTSRVRWPSM